MSADKGHGFDTGTPLPDPIQKVEASYLAISFARATMALGVASTTAARAADLFGRMLDHANTIKNTPRH